MMATFETSYQQFGAEESEDTPQGSGVMIHVVPEGGKAARWNHIEDLDTFFTRIYQYHQKHGFACMMLQEVFELFQFIFVLVFSMFLFNCVNYPVLFRNKVDNTTRSKITINDALYPSNVCVSNMGMADWSIIVVAIFFWLLRAIKVIYHLFQYWDVKSFFNTALKINDNELDNVTWHEVQKKLREVQLEQEMCIHKRDLTELDIYHRILRFKNYMVAMVNKSLLPPRFNLPLIGEVVYLSHGLKYNIELLLFWGPWSPFENNWHLKEDYKKVSKRKDLADNLSKHIWYVAIANLVLCPLILLWQILYFFFNYAEVLKREPGMLGVRCWSQYGKLYLRHFNELDHELNARLNRAYRPASKYMNIFTSPLMTVIAKNVVFVAGALLAVLLALSVYDEDVLAVEHVLTAITVLGAVVAGFRVLIPDEHLVWWPEQLMSAILAHVHYLPSHWRGNAHTNTVRAQFSQLFQYKATYVIAELVSPIVTPLLLILEVRRRSLELVDFYRSFTVQVAGVGDVCAFAQMDIRTHGDPTWHNLPHRPTTNTQYTQVASPCLPSRRIALRRNMSDTLQAEEGKTELSLVHFTLTNPEWSPPHDAEGFVSGVREQAKRHLLPDQSFSSVPHPLSSLVAKYSPSESPAPSHLSGSNVHTNVSRNEGPISERHYVQSGVPVGGMASLGASVFGQDSPTGNADPIEMTAMDMSINTLYLHQMHHRAVQRRGGASSRSTLPPQNQERLPLLHSPTHPHMS